MAYPNTQRIIFDVIDTDVIASFAKFQVLMPEHMRVGLIEAMEYVGLVATSKYMTVRAVVNKATGARESRKGDKLNIDTSRLARSILGKESLFGNEAIRRVIRVGGNLDAEMGSTVPYAAIHEYGGKTGAGKKTTIPARPYLNPALKDSESFIYALLKAKLQLVIRETENVK